VKIHATEEVDYSCG